MGQNSMFFFKDRFCEKNRRKSMAVGSALSGGGFYSETSGVTEKHVAKSEVILCAGAGNQKNGRWMAVPNSYSTI